MHPSAYRLVDVVATLEAVGVQKEMLMSFWEATERSPVLTWTTLVDALVGAGISLPVRMAVMTRLCNTVSPLTATALATPVRGVAEALVWAPPSYVS